MSACHRLTHLFNFNQTVISLPSYTCPRWLCSLMFSSGMPDQENMSWICWADWECRPVELKAERWGVSRTQRGWDRSKGVNNEDEGEWQRQRKGRMGGGRAGSSQVAFEAGSWRDNRGGFTPETQRSDTTMGVTQAKLRLCDGDVRPFIVSAEHLCAILRHNPTAECKEGAGDKWASKHGRCLNKPPV